MKPQSFACVVAALQELVLSFSSPHFSFICYQGHGSSGTACHTGWPVGRKLAFLLLSIPYLLMLRGVYIECQLQFTLSNLHAESKNVNIFHICLFALLEWFLFSCWKTLECTDHKSHRKQHWGYQGHPIQAILIQRYPSFAWTYVNSMHGLGI